jgi:hypothetical protein
MKTQIKHTADGTPYTEIQKPFDAEWVKEQLRGGNPVLCAVETNVGERVVLVHAYTCGDTPLFAALSDEHENEPTTGGYSSHIMNYIRCSDFLGIVINLPALPKHPENKDINLILQYWANGLIPHGDFKMLRVFYDEERNLLPKSLWKYKVFKDLMVAVNPFEIGRYVDLYAEIESLEAEGEKITITHCEDSQGNKHEVAIIED